MLKPPPHDGNTVCIHHRGCFDGLASAWVVSNRYPGAELIPAQYYDPPPPAEKIAGRHVVIVDFSFSREELLKMAEWCASVIVLDHHDTARKNCEGLPFALFDNERAGCALAWDFFNPGKPRPAVIEYAQDYDLWRFALPLSGPITTAMHSYPRTLETMNMLHRLFVHDESHAIEALAGEGHAIMRYRDQLVEEIVGHAMELEIGGNNVLGVECPRELRDFVASRLAEGRLFGVTFNTKSDGTRTYSLRVREGSGFNVAELAKSFGGGGHEQAAGFRVKLGGGADPFAVTDRPMLEALNRSHVPSEKT